jgi:hypothetical protein
MSGAMLGYLANLVHALRLRAVLIDANGQATDVHLLGATRRRLRCRSW